ncbi:DUF1850 domain-containing protein [Sediminibacillus massiliensis]|uniref:DUF1850 domain-containing protein n=1 Tax=Sediminibacillus massiliensis TaxID=1926277 RepID=UPI0009889028|nr:DUF1850 domain-containing protein [Sediminibacillus massiliensis]
MARYKKVLSFSVVFILFSSFVFLFLFYPYRYVLSFQDPFTDKVAAFLPIKNGDHFYIQFTHSVHLSEVFEEYEIIGDTIYPVQLVYEDTAIGMPSNAQEGETFEVKDGKYYISNLQGSYPEINLAVGQVRANHTILYNNKEYLLKDYVGAGTSISIVPVYQNNWNLFKGVNMLER